MPSKNTLTEMFGVGVGVGLLRPVIVTSVDALSIRPDPFGDVAQGAELDQRAGI
ncbi:MAG: hypothetical protein ACXVBB_05675 [Isosphaeraceae bacterium]